MIGLLIFLYNYQQSIYTIDAVAAESAPPDKGKKKPPAPYFKITYRSSKLIPKPISTR